MLLSAYDGRRLAQEALDIQSHSYEAQLELKRTFFSFVSDRLQHMVLAPRIYDLDFVTLDYLKESIFKNWNMRVIPTFMVLQQNVPEAPLAFRLKFDVQNLIHDRVFSSKTYPAVGHYNIDYEIFCQRFESSKFMTMATDTLVNMQIGGAPRNLILDQEEEYFKSCLNMLLFKIIFKQFMKRKIYDGGKSAANFFKFN